MSVLPKLGKLVSSRTALLVCDMQEKFRYSISHFNAICNTSGRLIAAAKMLEVPVVITEMYPKGISTKSLSPFCAFQAVKCLTKLLNVCATLRRTVTFMQPSSISSSDVISKYRLTPLVYVCCYRAAPWVCG